jgi:hypothetical protein
MTAYTIQLITLLCIQSSRLAGDVTALKLNGRQVWSSGDLRLHPRPTKACQVNRVDFANGTHHNSETQVLIAAIPPHALEFDGLTERAQVALIEVRPMFDRLLGLLMVNAWSAECGTMTAVFVNGAAHYALTYCVTRCFSGDHNGHDDDQQNAANLENRP